jgi:hypothetical protein
MNKAIFYCILSSFLVSTSISKAQIIRGVIYDKKSNSTMPGATVYQDGTTNITVTDDKGFFQLNLRGLDNSLIISFIGFQSKRVDNPLQHVNAVFKLYLDEELFNLDEVVVMRQDLFTRRQMLRAFRREFLGASTAAERCYIINEDDLILTYNVAEQKLMATSKKPLKIINKYLEYEMNFDLSEFSVYFWNKQSLDANVVASSYFDGFSYYVDFSKNGKAEKKRLKTYEGSTPHFIYSLAYGKMKEEKWELIVDGGSINPYDYFEISDTLQAKKVKLIQRAEKIVNIKFSEQMLKNLKSFNREARVDSLGVVRVPTFFTPYYNNYQQSRMDFETDAIYVDLIGNFIPLSGVLFAGYLGSLRAADLLPLEYLEILKKRVKTGEK